MDKPGKALEDFEAWMERENAVVAQRMQDRETRAKAAWLAREFERAAVEQMDHDSFLLAIGASA